MKLLALLLAAAGLSGCVAYPYAPGGSVYYGQGGYYGQGAPYVVDQPVYIYGGGGYRGGPGYRQGSRRDRDRDGIPDRVDRDRDGDGVPNRLDSRPSDPRRR
jgi:hypothetical protein